MDQQVTIGIPFCGGEVYLRLAVRSVFAQQHTNWRLILVNDGATDGSLAFARTIRDPRVEVMSDGAALGLAARLNQIAAMTRTTYLCRMDADDVMHPARLAAQLRTVAGRPNLDVIGSGAFSIDEHDAVRGYRGNGGGRITPGGILARGLFDHPTVFGKAEWFRRNPYDERYRRAQDLELWTRTASRTSWGFVADPLLYYREPAVVRLEAYIASSRCVRAIIRHYGPGLVGKRRAGVLLARSYAKELMYRAATKGGVSGLLVTRRSRRLTPEESQIAAQGMATVLGTPIPGVE